MKFLGEYFSRNIYINKKTADNLYYISDITKNDSISGIITEALQLYADKVKDNKAKAQAPEV